MPAREAGGGAGGGMALGRDLIVFVCPGIRHLIDIVLPDVEIFDCRLGRKRLRPNICFPLPRFTHAPYGLERSGNHGGQREQAKAEWISLHCVVFKFRLF